MSDTYDRTSKLKIDSWELEHSRFKKTSTDKIAVRVGNESSDPLSVNVVNTTAATKLAEHNDISSVSNAAEVTLLTYTVPVGQLLTLSEIFVSGTNKAKFRVEIDGTQKAVKRTYFTEFNTSFNFNNFKVAAGLVVRVFVSHTRPMVGDFEATLLGSVE